MLRAQCGGVLYTMPKIPVYLHSIKDVFFVEWRIHDFPNGGSADNLLFGNLFYRKLRNKQGLPWFQTYVLEVTLRLTFF